MTADSSHSGSYILDPNSPTELARLIDQGRFITEAMGGPLSGIEKPSSLHTVLDLACGPGSWPLDVAFAYPDIEVTGIDISKPMIDYANARAQSQQLTNVSFSVMDITKPLDLSDNSFDLANTRLLFGVLLRSAWPPFLSECFRALKPGGIIRLTEFVACATSSSSMQQQYALLSRFLFLRGYGFSPDGSTVGVATALPGLLRSIGFEQINHIAHVQDYSQGSRHWADGYRDQEIVGLTLLPLFVKQGLLSQEEADHLHQQTLIDFLADDFCSMGYYHTVLAVKPMP